MERVSHRATELTGSQKQASTQSKVAVGASIIFWPSLFFIKSNTHEATEYARIKGEFVALEKAAIAKNCNMTVQEVPAA